MTDSGIWKKVKQPTLFLFAGVDEWVPIGQSMINYKDATVHLWNVIFKQVAGTDHLMRNPSGEISKEYLDVLIDWLRPRFSIAPSA